MAGRLGVGIRPVFCCVVHISIACLLWTEFENSRSLPFGVMKLSRGPCLTYGHEIIMIHEGAGCADSSKAAKTRRWPVLDW
jgi:hypothetical protein